MLAGEYPRTLGIDPSLACSGFALLDEQARLVWCDRLPQPRGCRADRLLRLFRFVRDCCWTHEPELIAIETSSTVLRRRGEQSDALTTYWLGAAVGAVLAGIGDAQTAEYPVMELPLSKIRLGFCGSIYAGKAQVIEGARLRGYELPRDRNGAVRHDIADALACAVVGQAEWRVAQFASSGGEACNQQARS